MKTDEQKLLEIKEQEKQARGNLAELARRRREIMIRLHNSGMTFEKIGEIYGVTKQRAEYIIRHG